MKQVRTADNNRMSCLLPSGHAGGCNPFSRKAEPIVEHLAPAPIPAPVVPAPMPADEMPIFTIKASDPFACAVIRLWITMAASYRKINGVKPVPREKVVDAESVLGRFQRWQFDHGTKIPD